MGAVIVIDDEEPGINSGDLIFAAEGNAEMVAFMVRYNSDTVRVPAWMVPSATGLLPMHAVPGQARDGIPSQL